MPFPKEPTPAMLATRWKPGQAPVSPGRPKGLERLVRETVSEAGFIEMTKIMMGIVMGVPPPGASEMTIKTRDRTEAYKVLCDRGWGKARTTVELAADINTNGLGGINVDELDDAGFDILVKSFEEMAEKAGLNTGASNVVDAVAVEVTKKP